MATTSRLLSSGSLLVNGEFDEVSLTAGAIAFSGSSQYLTVAANAALDLPGDFTIESWVYPTGSKTTADIIAGRWISGDRVWLLNFGATSNLVFQVNGATLITYSFSITYNTWYHVAVTRSGTTVTLWLNGVSVGTGTSSYNFTSATRPLLIGRNGDSTDGTQDWLGYMSNFRIVKGTAVYTSTFTPPQSILPAIANTQLLLNVINSANFIRDSSPNNLTVTNTGTATWVIQGPYNQIPTSGSSGAISFNGSSQYLTVPSNAAFVFGTGDFTIEAWVYLAGGTTGTIFDNRTGLTSTQPVFYFAASATVMGYYIGGTNFITSGSFTFLNRWVHVALCRASGSTRMFFNGVQTGSTYADTTNYSASGTVGVGAAGYSAANKLNGYITNLRVVKGTGLYTTTFNPPITPLTTTPSTTSLLLNASSSSNFTTDSSANNFTVTNVGSATYIASSPLTGARQRTTSAGALEVLDQFDEISFVPGSWTLSGSQGVTVGNSSVFALPGDFTVEFFFYLSSVPSTEIDFWESQTSTTFRILKRGSSSGLSYDAYGGTSYLIAADASIPTNQWNHVAVSRTGTTIQAYFNGTRTINQTDATSFGAPTANYSVGCRAAGTNGLAGSISNFRLITGAGMYTGATIPVPTAPLGNVTGTQLLLPTPYTGGAFFDYSTNNFTVTKVSTPTSGSVSPFTVNTPQRLTSTGILQVENDFDEVSLLAGAIAFNGTNQYLNLGGQSAFAFSTGDWTIEAWIYIPAYAGTFGVIYDGRPLSTASTANYVNWGVLPTGGLNYYTAAANPAITGGTISLNTWTHVALSRVSSNTRMFINGVQTGSTYADSQTYTIGANRPTIGTDGNSPLSAGFIFNGYISNLRVLKGTGLYSGNFTPPQSVLPAITNTQLLLNVIDSANFIKDSSENNFTVTNVGTATWTASGPFNS